MAQHTPGPWQADTGTRHEHSIRANWHGEETTIARTMWATNVRGEPEDYEDENKANAVLMAAAPELLATCQAVLDWATRECMPQGGRYDGPWEQLEQVIAKATQNT